MIENDTAGFGIPRHIINVQKYIGRYCKIEVGAPSDRLGKPSEIDGEYLILNPYHGTVIENGRIIEKLIEDDIGASVKIAEITGMIPMPKEVMEAILDSRNKRNLDNHLEKPILKKSNNLVSFLQRCLHL
jgi:hypothetical protein